jgi:hypothetical protein
MKLVAVLFAASFFIKTVFASISCTPLTLSYSIYSCFTYKNVITLTVV